MIANCAARAAGFETQGRERRSRLDPTPSYINEKPRSRLWPFSPAHLGERVRELALVRADAVGGFLELGEPAEYLAVEPEPLGLGRMRVLDGLSGRRALPVLAGGRVVGCLGGRRRAADAESLDGRLVLLLGDAVEAAARTSRSARSVWKKRLHIA